MTVLKNIRRSGCMAAVAIASLAFAAAARSSVTISITDTNSFGFTYYTSVTSTASSPPATAFFTGATFGDFSNLTISAQAIPASGFNGAELSDVQLSGIDTGGPVGSTDTLTVSVVGGDFITPSSTNLTVMSTLASSNLSNGAIGTFKSSLLSGTFTNPYTALLTINGNGQASQLGTTSTSDTAPTINASSNGISFQLANTLTSTFSAGQTGTFTATTQVTVAPEPSSLMIVAAGGLLTLVRRRRRA